MLRSVTTPAETAAVVRDGITRLNRRLRQARPLGELTQSQLSALTSLELAGALTPTELDVVRLVSEGLGNKDIATRLFISPRTVQTHLTHVYAKVGLTSRVQLAQEAARHD